MYEHLAPKGCKRVVPTLFRPIDQMSMKLHFKCGDVDVYTLRLFATLNFFL